MMVMGTQGFPKAIEEGIVLKPYRACYHNLRSVDIP